MVDGSALYTRNVYLPFIRPNATQADMLRTGRITSVILVVGGLLFAFLFPSVIQGLKYTWEFMAYLGVAFWFGVIWRQANRYGTWASIITMIVLTVITGNVLGWPLQWQIATYLPVGIIVMWGVSYLTPGEPEEKLDQFYMLLDTPVGKEERLHDANVPIKLEGISQGKTSRKKLLLAKFFPSSEEVDDGLLLVDLLHLKERFTWKKYRTDILGFLAGCMIVIILIIALIFVAQIGT
jgi:hypothetical protein